MVRYFYWDPDKALLPFNLPLLDRPILWYGFLFAAGFFLGYWIVLYFLKRYLLTCPFFNKEDILKPNALVSFLYSEQTGRNETIRRSLWQAVDAKTKMQISHNTALGENAKIGLVKAFNYWIGDERRTEEYWPHKMFFLKKAWQKLSTDSAKNKIRSRLILDEFFSPSVSSIEQRARDLVEKITVAMVLGAVIGSRLGDVLFYQSWQMLKEDPLYVFKVWEGGLASHGGAAGILIALFFLARNVKRRYSSLNALRLLDLVVIPTALAGCLIRIGNFFNQEILGKQTAVPWAVIFGHPADGSSPAPRHPVQLYEAFFYLFSFFILFAVGKRQFELKKEGRILGLFFILIFGFRFFIEFYKTEQSALLTSSFLTMGQYLSIPFVLLGIFLCLRREK